MEQKTSKLRQMFGFAKSLKSNAIESVYIRFIKIHVILKIDNFDWNGFYSSARN